MAGNAQCDKSAMLGRARINNPKRSHLTPPTPSGCSQRQPRGADAPLTLPIDIAHMELNSLEREVFTAHRDTAR